MLTIHTMNYYAAGKKIRYMYTIMKDLQEIWFREKEVAEKYISRDATYIKVIINSTSEFVYTHKMVHK